MRFEDTPNQESVQKYDGVKAGSLLEQGLNDLISKNFLNEAEASIVVEAFINAKQSMTVRDYIDPLKSNHLRKLVNTYFNNATGRTTDIRNMFTDISSISLGERDCLESIEADWSQE